MELKCRIIIIREIINNFKINPNNKIKIQNNQINIFDKEIKIKYEKIINIFC